MKRLFRAAPSAEAPRYDAPVMAAHLRLATPADAGGVHDIYAPIVCETAISFELEPPTVDEMRRRITSTLTNYPWLVCEVDGLVAGYAYAGPHGVRGAYQWAADVSVYNHGSFRGRGIGRALYAALLEILARQGVRQACAGITLPNDASVGLHEAMGFRPLGVYPDIGYKLGAWHSVGWWQRALAPASDPPPIPVMLPQLSPGRLEDPLAGATATLAL